ncbi:hypothetical protein [Antribacter gilvus]|uniref:hypothetical protein n=1 Tax=Antribacter gilvus TaxID=2304675 RepID=UPI000F79753B|nr:hypothetical protein [Antribacter gilvus]
MGELLAGTLGIEKQIVSVELGDRFAVRPAGDHAKDQRVPLAIGGEHLADLSIALYQSLDRSGAHLKTGVDSVPGWDRVIQEGRVRWRTRQFRSAVRDLQVEAADVLEKEGWALVPPPVIREAHLEPYRRW